MTVLIIMIVVAVRSVKYQMFFFVVVLFSLKSTYKKNLGEKKQTHKKCVVFCAKLKFVTSPFLFHGFLFHYNWHPIYVIAFGIKLFSHYYYYCASFQPWLHTHTLFCFVWFLSFRNFKTLGT